MPRRHYQTHLSLAFPLDYWQHVHGFFPGARERKFMSHIKQFIPPARQALKWKAALPALALALAAASLAGCAQSPAAQPGSAARTPSAQAGYPDKPPGMHFAPCPKPQWPKDALARRSEGKTRVQFLIDTDGTVAESKILKSSGDASLDEAARTALAKCVFRPALRAGKPERAWVPVEYVWTLSPKK
ncbi:MAG: energy transducer TonB [Telluria sp.]